MTTATTEKRSMEVVRWFLVCKRKCCKKATIGDDLALLSRDGLRTYGLVQAASFATREEAQSFFDGFGFLDRWYEIRSCLVDPRLLKEPR